MESVGESCRILIEGIVMNDICILGTNSNAIKLIESLRKSPAYQINCIAEIDYKLWNDSKEVPICSLGKAGQLYHSGKIHFFIIVSDNEDKNNLYYRSILSFGVNKDHVLYASLAAMKKCFSDNQLIEHLKPYHLRDELETIEIHLAEHCNLNCKFCSMFCGLVTKPQLLDLNEFSIGLHKLKLFFSHIKRIRIIGGEPLLHPSICDFFSLIRSVYPETEIRLLTNGILLPQMPKSFFIQLKAFDVHTVVTFYPAISNSIEKYNQLMKCHNVDYEITSPVTHFLKIYDMSGQNDPAEQFRKCHWRGYCATMYGSKIAACFVPFVINHFFDRFESHKAVSGIIDLFESGLTTEIIRERLEQPFEMCKYCSFEKNVASWSLYDSKSGLSKDDWSV